MRHAAQMRLHFSENIEQIDDTFATWKTLAKELAESATGTNSRIALARSVCNAALKSHWKTLCQRHGCVWEVNPSPLPPVPLTDAASSFAHVIGTTAASLPIVHAGYLISSLYTIMLPEEMRSRLGAYYTPPALVERLLDMVTEAGFDWEKGRALDPACGGGAFLAPVAIRMAKALKSADPAFVLRNITTRLHGFEIDPFAAWMSLVLLEAALLDVCLKAGQRLPSVVTTGDALAIPVDERRPCDLVIGNPPYGKVTLPEAQREHYRRSLHGHANLYGLFTDLAIRWVKTGGIVSYVTPTSFLGGQYFKALRLLLKEEAPPLMMDFITERQGIFEDVLQETMLTVYSRTGQTNRPVTVHFLKPNGNGKPVQVQEVGRFLLPDKGDEPWLLPREPGQTALLRKMVTMPHRLSDYGFTVSTGQLVWNRHKEQLKMSMGKQCFPLIWAESVTAERKFRFSAMRRNHAPYFQVRLGQDYLITKGSCVLVQRTTAKEQKRRLIAAVLPEAFVKKHGGVVVENHLNMIRPLSGKPSISFSVLAVLLNTHTLDRAFRCISGSVAVSAYELNALPLPSPEEMTTVAQLVKAGAPQDVIEQTVADIYGGSNR